MIAIVIGCVVVIAIAAIRVVFAEPPPAGLPVAASEVSAQAVASVQSLVEAPSLARLVGTNLAPEPVALPVVQLPAPDAPLGLAGIRHELSSQATDDAVYSAVRKTLGRSK